jgi:peptidylprolyl isomerase
VLPGRGAGAEPRRREAIATATGGRPLWAPPFPYHVLFDVMSAVQKGDTVRIHYTGTLADGTEFDSSEGRDPLEFTVGGGQVIPGFDQAVQGLTVGDEKEFTIPAEEAYGDRREEMLMRIERTQMPPELDPEVGDELQLQTPDGRPVPVRVAEIDDEAVVLDANHPLAGEDLTFQVRVEEIV